MDRNITITKAQWGKYNTACFDNCCPPNPAIDCTVDMQTVEPDLFEYIKDQCDGKQSCELDFIAYEVDECLDGYIADYEQVFYDCLPFDTTEPIGFSAKLTSSGS